jgi:cell division protein FtsW (lipid II flippase)
MFFNEENQKTGYNFQQSQIAISTYKWLGVNKKQE